MDSNNQELYKRLCLLRDKLQNQHYDYYSNRKPTICSEETLKLLAKYKPITINDMANISGVGNVFLNNYSKYFLKVIQNYVQTDKLEITDSEKMILSKLENRLVNINRKNRLLYSSKINKDYGLDLFKLVSNIKELENFIINRDSKAFRLITIEDFGDDKLKTILKLNRQVTKIEVETGNNELYVAYPFVQGKLEQENFNVKSPLMLFPVKIERTSNSVFLLNDFNRDILYNTNLILANNKFNGKNEVLPDNAVDEFDSNNYINDMLKFYNDNKFYLNYKPCELEKFFENKLSEFPNYQNGELEIKKYMLLGIYSNYVTTMYGDFHKMITENNFTNLIKKLLVGLEKSENNIDISYNEDDNTESSMSDIEDEIYYINELDFSQEKVLKKINKTDSLVVSGPPGTGKSQTITSIITQAILQNKKVLMVSEKKTALDVIYSRLGKLSKFAILIDDVENKQDFYEQLNSIVEEANSSYLKLGYNDVSQREILKSIQSKIANIDYDTKCLEQIAKKVYEINDFETTMFNVYNICCRYDLSDTKEIADYEIINNEIENKITEIKYPKLTEIKNLFNEDKVVKDIDMYLETLNKIPYIKEIKTNLLDIELIEFLNKLNEVADFINEFKNMPFYKKIFLKKELIDKINIILDNYFLINNKEIAKVLVENVNILKEFIPKYQEFVSNKFIYEKLDLAQKEYAKTIIKIKDKLNISFTEANNKIYNTLLFNVICDFEKNNPDVLNYISNFDNIRNEIHKYILEKKDLTCKLVYRKLLENIRNLNCNNKLNKIAEMCNRKRKMAVNKFMAKYKFEMLDSIKIWLMTPEVVSDIMPFEKNVFDLVIFDEASQLYIEKSIPAIYRARKVIVAGDQKQLKPSSLGKGRILDEIDEDEVSDGFLEYESLLEAARYKYEHTMLNYHYRSKYEELIAFSNYAFYNGKLMVTSLANEKENHPIERIKVENGRWIDKKNQEEAKAVVKLLKEILNNRKNNETIGVITFNSSQMSLIEDLIENEKMIDVNFATQMLAEENRFLNGENISFFVKNIESVQGDERDIIIFSVGYAKNETGRVAINFGWLNQDGGENRLNVAISRAKQKIYVVTSIEPEELVVDYTKNVGPKLFKKYLEYVKAVDAGNKKLVKNLLLSLLDKEKEENELTFDSEFEEEVCAKLVERGYKVETQYGVGGYRIDLVIKSFDGKENLLGIECDGRLYHSSKYARERDYHRQKYLESRGWKIYRIWSSNWWKNPDLEINKIIKYLEKISNNDDE